jgi:hypothetical protein
VKWGYPLHLYDRAGRMNNRERLCLVCGWIFGGDSILRHACCESTRVSHWSGFLGRAIVVCAELCQTEWPFPALNFGSPIPGCSDALAHPGQPSPILSAEDISLQVVCDMCRTSCLLWVVVGHQSKVTWPLLSLRLSPCYTAFLQMIFSLPEGQLQWRSC